MAAVRKIDTQPTPTPTPLPGSKPKLDQRIVLYTLIALILLVGTLQAKIITDTGSGNLYAQQAGAFLHGRTTLPHYSLDVAVFHGHFYVPFPPLPSLLLLPFVAVFGVAATKATVVALGLTVLNVWLLSSILTRLGVPARSRPWLLAAFFGGTAYWFCLRGSGGVWHFAHICAVTFLLAAVQEALGRGRGWRVGLWIGFAFLSRQMLLGSLVFLVTTLLIHPAFPTRREKTRQMLGFALSLGLCLMVYLAFNALRFGSPLDTGYGDLRLHGFLQERFARYGLFHPAYFLFNVTHLFLQGFHLDFDSATMLHPAGMDPFGTSLICASPFLLAAFRARWDRPRLHAAWVSVALTCLPALFYYNNGYYQSNGQRFSLDFLPILILLTARGTEHVPEKLWKGAVFYAVALNALALCFFTV